ncbi:MAG TPA: PIN domain-containing protein [Pirellulales bacterium]|nr:PIN domain-containing protein [Pirellulales bacterium]
MKILRVYLDTSVFGGCFDAPFEADSYRVFSAAHASKLVVLVSPLVVDELVLAPDPVRRILADLPVTNVEPVKIDAEVLVLRDAYLLAGVLSDKWRNDALHVAAATVARADAIVSWNFHHIVRLDKIKAFNAVNLLNGYGLLTIISPKECVTDDTPDD